MTVIYIGSSNMTFPVPGYALYDGSKVAPQFLVEVLEKEIGHRGVSVNSIVPTAIEGAGVYGDGVSAEFRNFIKSFRPVQQMGRPSEVANVGEYRVGDLAAFGVGCICLLQVVHRPRCANETVGRSHNTRI
jgi:3-oxoacyl-[acyl-carrier protein] reductase